MSDSHFPKAVTMEIHILQNQVSEVEDGKTLDWRFFWDVFVISQGLWAIQSSTR